MTKKNGASCTSKSVQISDGNMNKTYTNTDTVDGVEKEKNTEIEEINSKVNFQAKFTSMLIEVEIR